jgi:hypothetical protein
VSGRAQPARNVGYGSFPEVYGAETAASVTIDVEWAHPEVLADTLALIDARGLRATFFCTHAGIDVGVHERALHPNFRRQGNSVLANVGRDQLAGWTDEAFYRYVIEATRPFCPEAIGVRSHALFYDAPLLGLYRAARLEYDSSAFLPLTPSIVPVSRGFSLVELPIYYMDHWDLVNGRTGFALDRLHLDSPGLKVLDFHPTLIYINAATPAHYAAARPGYHQPEQLKKRRFGGRGCRTLFEEVLDWLAASEVPVRPLAGLNAAWRTVM